MDGEMWYGGRRVYTIREGSGRSSEVLRTECGGDQEGTGSPSSIRAHAAIKEQVHFERTEGAKSYWDLLKPGIFRRVGLGAALQMWSQLSGMNIMM